MALRATIYKADVQISDMDRQYYATHSLTLAKHPSETDERLMARLLMFMVYANERLTFSKGLSDVEEPDVWEKDLTDAIQLWIDVGQPDETRMRKASHRAEQALVLTYTHSSNVWWKKVANKVSQFNNLTVLQLNAESSQELSKLAARNMQLQCTIQDGEIWLSTEDAQITLKLDVLQAARPDQHSR